MAATATPINARHAVGGLFDSSTTTPPAPPAVAEAEVCVQEQRQRRRRRQRGISPSDPPPVPSTPSPPPSSSASSSGTARYPAGSAANSPSSTPQHQHHHHSSSSPNNNGRSPLLQSSAETSVKSYGTASDASDDAGTHSGQSAIVAQRSITSTADGDSPRPPNHDTPLSGTCAPTPTDASIRVNDVLAGARHADHAHYAAQGAPTGVPASTNNYVERGVALHDEDVQNTQHRQPPQQAQPPPFYDPHRHRLSTTAMSHRGGKQGGGGSGTSPTAPAPPPAAAAGGQGTASGADAHRGDHAAAPMSSPSLHRSGYDEGGAATGGAVPVLPLGVPGALPSFSELILRRVRTTSLLQFLWVVLLMLMLLVGNACQVIFLNFWIHQFPKKADKPTCRSTTGSSQSGSGGNSDGPERAEALESSYTTFIISATIFSSFFVILLTAYWFWRRTNLKFVREWAGWRLLLGIGAMDTLNSGMAIYAAAHTPEVLQALFVSLVPIYSAFFTKWLLKDPRSYGNVYVTISFALIMAGVGLASLFSYVATHQHSADSGASSSGAAGVQHKPAFLFNFLESDGGSAVARDRRLWCFIFFLSVPPTVLMNVWQTMYMIRYTESDELTSYLAEHEGEAENSILRTSVTSTGEIRTEVVEDGADVTHRERQAGDLHGQLAAAAAAGAAAPHGEAGDGAAASAGAPLLASDGNSPRSSGAGSDDVATSVEHRHRLHVPASALHLHGEDTTVKLVMLAADTTIQALMAFVLMPLDAMPWFGGSDSIQEVWQNLDDGVDCVLHCPRNLRYCLLYSMGFVLVYIAAAYLNRYSVTLCSMVSQLSGPITALVLIAFPSLNMTGDAAPWYVSVFAVVLLSFGTVIYVYWDEMTGEEKARGEMQLKWEMMEEQARRHQPVDDGGDSAPGGSGPAHYDSTQQQQHHRRSRTRRYRRRRQSSYVVIVDHDPDAPQAPVQAAAGVDRRI